MPIYEIQDKDGSTFEIESATDPTPGQIKKALAVYKRQNVSSPKSAEQIQNDMNASGDFDTSQKVGKALAPRTAAYQMEREAAPFNPSAGLPTSDEGVLPPDQIANVVAANQNPIDFKKFLSNVASDAISLPGRMMASAPEAANIPKAVVNPKQYAADLGASMSQTESSKPGLSGFAGDIMRSPAAGAAMLTGGLGAGYLPAAAGGAGATQIEHVAKGEPVSPIEAGVETAAGVVGGKLAKAGGDVLADKANMLIKKTVSEATTKLVNGLKNAKNKNDLLKSVETSAKKVADAVAYNKNVVDALNEWSESNAALKNWPGMTGGALRMLDATKFQILDKLGKIGKMTGLVLSKNPETGAAILQETEKRATSD